MVPCIECAEPDSAVTERGKCLECCYVAVAEWAAANPYEKRQAARAKAKAKQKGQHA